MPKTAATPKGEALWQAEDDFRTLANAEEITSDRGRLGKAKRAGRALVKREKAALAKKERVASGRRGRK
jgi:hypothetical protein